MVEMRERLLSHLRGIAQYWATVPLDQDDLPQDETRYRIEGAVFSVLGTLDGATELPAFHLVPDPHPGDREYLKGEGECWWAEATSEEDGLVTGVSINGDTQLHELFYVRRG